MAAAEEYTVEQCRELLLEIMEIVCWGEIDVDNLAETLDGDEHLAQRVYDFLYPCE